MPLVSKDFIEELDQEPILNVLSALGIKAVGGRVEKQIKCLSSGHDDKNPSMSVNTGTGAFYCQGCGAKGKGAIACYAMHENRESTADFGSNIEGLSSLLGKTIEYQAVDGPKETKRNQLFSVMLEAMSEFIKIPDKKDEFNAFRAFNQSRGLSPADQDIFKFGYVPKNWHYSNTAKKHQATLIDIGLLKKDDKTGRIYSPLGGRVVFPINDERGRIIAMAGRDITGTAKAKYKNTDTSLVFKKSRVLYGINEVLQSLPKESRGKKIENFNVVEGYMDVIASHRHGFKNTVATMGTALTEEHLKLLSRYTDSVTFIFDPDEAGSRASDRALLAALPYTSTMNFNFVKMPVLNDVKYDPDQFLKDLGASAYSNALKVNTPIGTAAARYIMGTDNPDSVYELMQNGMPQRADEVYQLLPAGMVRPLIALEIAKVVGKKLDLPLTPLQLGMAFDESMVNKELTEELAQYRSGARKEPSRENLNQSSHSNSEAGPEKEKTAESKDNQQSSTRNANQESANKSFSKGAPAKQLPFNTRFISSSTPQPGVMVFDDSGQIFTVTAVTGESASLVNGKNKAVQDQALTNLVTLKPDRILSSRFSNTSSGLEKGDTLLMLDQVYVHSLDPSWHEASMNVFLHPECLEDRNFLHGVAVNNLVAQKITESNEINASISKIDTLHVDELKEKLGVNLISDIPTVVAKGYAPAKLNSGNSQRESTNTKAAVSTSEMPEGALLKGKPTAGGFVTQVAWKGLIGVVESVSQNQSSIRVPGLTDLQLCQNSDLLCVNSDRHIKSKHDTKVAKKGEPIHKFKDVPWLSKLPESWAEQVESEAKNKLGKEEYREEDNAPSL